MCPLYRIGYRHLVLFYRWATGGLGYWSWICQIGSGKQIDTTGELLHELLEKDRLTKNTCTRTHSRTVLYVRVVLVPAVIGRTPLTCFTMTMKPYVLLV